MKNSLLKSFSLILLTASFILVGCQSPLLTRSDVREVEQKKQFQDQVVTLQKNSADVNGRFAEIEDDLRRMVGRVEVLETRLAQSNSEKDRIFKDSEASHVELNKKITILQDEISRLDGQIAALTAETQKAQSAAASSSSSKKNDFEQGEDHFNAKEWRRAILSYQKYREANSKGKNFAEATYKIGVCFQELGLKDEARTFYEEVVAKHSKSAEAKKAKTRLNSLKK